MIDFWPWRDETEVGAPLLIISLSALFSTVLISLLSSTDGLSISKFYLAFAGLLLIKQRRLLVQYIEAGYVLYCIVLFRQLPYILVMGVVPSLLGNVCVYVCM